MANPDFEVVDWSGGEGPANVGEMSEEEQAAIEAAEREYEREQQQQRRVEVGGFVIEDDPLPPPASHAARKYPFDQMKIGQSFKVRPTKEAIEEHGLDEALRLKRSSLSSSASNFNKKVDDRKIVIRKVGPGLLKCYCVPPD